jgi:hypothetical protein
LAVDRNSPVVQVTNTITGRSSLVANLSGTIEGRTATGAVRIDRDAVGAVTSIVIGVVGTGQLMPGESRAERGGATVAYIDLAVRSAAERRLVEDWLSASPGFTVDAGRLLGLEAAEPDDRLGTYLARAATITLLRYADGDPTGLAAQVRSELEQQRRPDPIGARLSTVGAVAPEPSGGRRVLVEDPSCRR